MLRIIYILILFYLFFSSCDKIGSINDSRLQFSDDTILFDTVFSSAGSVTKELRIKNPGRHNLTIDHVYLAGGRNSQFRLNIDGKPLYEKFNVKIEPGDSIFIFIDVFIDPVNNNLPVEVSDSIIFLVGDNNQKVPLLAWGQDIYLIKNKTIQSETWQRGKPYVIYDRITVDTLETLLIEKGTRVLFHRNASMVIAGSIVVNGSVESPVLFSGDRLEKMYEDIPGQWKGILILNPSKANNISHAIIRNAVYGIQLGEAVFRTEVPVLKLSSTIISHSTISGLSALNGNVEASNCIFTHCGNYCIYIEAGGEYTFTYCTIYNRWEYGLRLYPALFITEKPQNNNVRTSQLYVHFNNSVVFGDNQSELNIIPLTSLYTGNYYFDHCLLKFDTQVSAFWDMDEFPGTIINKNPLFTDPSVFDLRPDTLSPLINNGSPVFSSTYPTDIRGVSRTLHGNPDIGAYERLPGEIKKPK